MAQTGLYRIWDYGCKTNGSGTAYPLAQDPYIRYHREGGLELSLMMIDWLSHTDDVAYFKAKLLPQVHIWAMLLY